MPADATASAPAVSRLHAIRRAVATALFGAAALLAAPPAAAVDCGAIDVAAFQWPAGELVAALVARALRDGYGCDASAQTASLDRAIAAIGAPGAPPLIAPGVPIDAVDERAEIRRGAALHGDGAREGWFAPKWFLALHPEIETLEDLALSARAFRDAGGQGRPRLHLCPTTWPCHGENVALVEELGLASVFEIVAPQSGEALEASIRDAFATQSPWVGYAWTPSAVVAENPLRALEIGEVQVCDGLRRREESCRAPFQSTPTVVAYPAALAETAPRLAAFLDRFAAPTESVVETLSWRAANNADLSQSVDRYLAAHAETWADWFDAAARDAFRAAQARRAATIDPDAPVRKTTGD